MTKRTTLLLVLGLLCLGADRAQASETYRILSGSRKGTYYRIAESLAPAWGDKRSHFSPVATPGSVQNLVMLALGQGEFALVQSDAFAFLTNDPNTRGLVQNVRMIAPLYTEEVHLVVRDDGRINSVSDLRGRRIATGPADSGTRISALAFLRFHGLDSAREIVPDYSSGAEALARLEAGKVDALFYTGGAPLPLLQNARSSLKLLPVLPFAAKSAIATQHYQVTELPAGTYPWQKSPVLTLSTRAVLVTSAKTRSSLVRRLVRRTYRSLEDLRNTHPKWREVRASDAIRLLTRSPIPLHLGARFALKELEQRATRRKEITYRLVTGSTQGSYYRIGRGIETASNQVRIKAVPSSGSLQNLIALNAGTADLALVQGDVMMILAQMPEMSPLVESVRVIAPLYVEEVHLIVRRDLEAKSIRDLVGRRLNLGQAGSGTSLTALHLLESNHIHPPHVQARFLDGKTSMNALVQGELDGLFFVGGRPLAFLASLPASHSKKIRLMPVAPKEFTFYRQLVISKNTYPWLNEDVSTLGTPCLLITRRGAPKSLVRGLLDGIYSQKGRQTLAAAHPKSVEMTREFGRDFLKDSTFGMHRAARAYFRASGE